MNSNSVNIQQMQRLQRLLPESLAPFFAAHVTRVVVSEFMEASFKVVEINGKLNIALHSSLTDKEVSSKLQSALTGYQSYSALRSRRASDLLFCWTDLNGTTEYKNHQITAKSAVHAPSIKKVEDTRENRILARLSLFDLGGAAHQEALNAMIDLASRNENSLD